MSRQHDPRPNAMNSPVPIADGKSLTPNDVTVEIRARLIECCWRPDKSAEQIIGQAGELERYILNGQP